MNRALSLLIALSSSVAVIPAVAQDATSLKKAMIGQWELATTERSKTCVLT
ncbi:MAG: peptidase, partial [Bradyrhizobium sp.]|nr:peptidase [Bradyrhizobium sp.]